MSDVHLEPCSAHPYRNCVSVRVDRPTRLLTIAEAREFARSLIEAARQAAEWSEPDTPAKVQGRKGSEAAKLKRLREKHQTTEVLSDE